MTVDPAVIPGLLLLAAEFAALAAVGYVVVRAWRCGKTMTAWRWPKASWSVLRSGA